MSRERFFLFLAAALGIVAVAVSLSYTNTAADASQAYKRNQLMDLGYNPAGPIRQLLKPNRTVKISVGGDRRQIPVYVVRTNSHGFRGAEFGRVPPPNTTRIAVIGDSYTFGWGVNRSDRYSNQVERLLNDNMEEQYEVINLGIPGAGIKDYYHLFKERAIPYQADVVVVGIQITDIFSLGTNARLEARARKELGLNQTVNDPRIDDKVRKYKRKMLAEYNLPGSPLPQRMKDMQRLAEEHNISLVFLTIWPFKDRQRSFFQNFTTRNNMTFLFAPPALRQDTDPYVVTPFDSHYNAAGHRVLAEHLYTSLNRSPRDDRQGS